MEAGRCSIWKTTGRFSLKSPMRTKKTPSESLLQFQSSNLDFLHLRSTCWRADLLMEKSPLICHQQLSKVLDSVLQWTNFKSHLTTSSQNLRKRKSRITVANGWRDSSSRYKKQSKHLPGTAATMNFSAGLSSSRLSPRSRVIRCCFCNCARIAGVLNPSSDRMWLEAHRF